MHPRHATRLAGLLSALLLLGAAAATTSVTVTVGPDGASVHAETDDVPKLPPREPEPPHPEPNDTTTFSVRVTPSHQNGTAGDTLYYLVVFSARRDVVIDAQAYASYDFRATLGQSEVAVRAGSNASVKLALATPSYDADGSVWINATARDTGENHGATGHASVRAPPEPVAKLSVSFERSVTNLTAGSNTSVKTYVESTANRTVTLSIGNVSQGYRASLSPDTVFAGPSWPGAATLFVWASPDATADGIVEVIAWTQEGETARARLYVRLVNESGPDPGPNGTEPQATADAPASAEPLPSPAPQPSAAPLVRVESRAARLLVESSARAATPMA